jgi:endonuclease YncB( thermonuclease family)
MFVFAVAVLASIVLSSPGVAQACSGCGCKGGPGYRAPNGRCVGWADIDRTCGRPPETRCTPELVPKQGPNTPENRPKSSLLVPDTGKVLGYGPKPPESRKPTSLVAERIDSGRVRVLDGDTIRLDRTKPDVRLVGCNAPETRRAKCEAERQLGGQATRRLRDLVEDGSLDFQYVACSCRPGTEGTSSCNYGRWCGVLKSNGRDVCDILILEKLAVPFACGPTGCPPTPQPWC